MDSFYFAMSIIILIFCFINWLICCSYAAQFNERDGLWLGILLGPVGLIVSAIVANGAEYKEWKVNRDAKAKLDRDAAEEKYRASRPLGSGQLDEFRG